MRRSRETELDVRLPRTLGPPRRAAFRRVHSVRRASVEAPVPDGSSPCVSAGRSRRRQGGKGGLIDRGRGCATSRLSNTTPGKQCGLGLWVADVLRHSRRCRAAHLVGRTRRQQLGEVRGARRARPRGRLCRPCRRGGAPLAGPWGLRGGKGVLGRVRAADPAPAPGGPGA